MANIQSKKKRIKTNEKARLRNKSFKSAMRTSLKKTEEAIASGNKEVAISSFNETNKMLDKGISKGVIHKNNVARNKSRLMKKINEM